MGLLRSSSPYLSCPNISNQLIHKPDLDFFPPLSNGCRNSYIATGMSYDKTIRAQT